MYNGFYSVGKSINVLGIDHHSTKNGMNMALEEGEK